MLAIGIVNFIFMSHLSYIIAERRSAVYRSRQFWLLIDGLLLSLYVTIRYMYMAVEMPLFF